MSTLYTDSEGNYYLGDCVWANHDINYAAVNWLKSHEAPTRAEFLTDMQTILSSAGYGSISVASSYPTSLSGDIFQATNSTGALTINHYLSSSDVARIEYLGAVDYEVPEIPLSDGYGYANQDFHYAVCGTGQTLSMLKWVPSTNRSTFAINPQFLYCGVLDDVNANFGYYSTSEANHHVSISLGVVSSVGYATTFTNTHYAPQHFIAGASKVLLQTDAAQYPITCANGASPTAQWATDMYVFDNDVTLGYPCIGKVRNLLLGTGTYTFLKPVKVQIAAYDNGSPWYVPVGRYAGKTLLMRVYSSVV